MTLQRIEKTAQQILSNNSRVFLFLLFIGIVSKLVYFFASSAWMNDEYFYLQGGKEILDGRILYKDFVDIKPPLIFFLYAGIIKIFSYENALIGIKITNVFSQICTAYIFFKIIESFTSRKRALLSSFLMLLALSIDNKNWPLNTMALSLLPLGLFSYFISKDHFRLNPKNLLSAGLFLGINFLLSTNYFVYLILLPIFMFFMEFKVKEIVVKNVILFLGFLLPLLSFIIYFNYHNALQDWYWWNIKWASYYSAEWPMYLKIPTALWTLFLSWQLIPIYFLGIIGMVTFYKNRNNIENTVYFFLILFVLVAFLSRILLGRITPRYNPYLLPVFILLIGFVRFDLLKKWMYQILIVFLAVGFLYSNIHSICYPYDLGTKSRKEINKWLLENTPKNKRIFVWSEGYDFYYSSKNEMATGFFSCDQHLNYPPIFNDMNDQDIDYVWQKFFSQLETDNPIYIVDMTGNFSIYNKKKRMGKVKDYMILFQEIVLTKFKLEKEFNIIFRHNSNRKTYESIKIWKRK